MTASYTADHVLATFTFDELISFAVDLGAPPGDLALLPDDPSRGHWASAYVAETMNRITELGLTAEDWVYMIADYRAAEAADDCGSIV